MATRPKEELQNRIVWPFTVQTGAVALGKLVKFGTTDSACQPAAAGDLAFGVVVDLGKIGTGAIGTEVGVMLLGINVVSMTVGTGGTTRGVIQQVVADGVTDTTPSGAGTALVGGVGIAMQTGVVGDKVGVMTGFTYVNE